MKKKLVSMALILDENARIESKVKKFLSAGQWGKALTCSCKIRGNEERIRVFRIIREEFELVREKERLFYKGGEGIDWEGGCRTVSDAYMAIIDRRLSKFMWWRYLGS